LLVKVGDQLLELTNKIEKTSENPR